MRIGAFLSLCLCQLLSAGPLDDSQNCQPFDDSIYYAISDPSLGESGIFALDEFVPGDGTLSQVRVWGFYFNGDPDIANDCGPQVVEDVFRVRIFENDPVSGRRPAALFAESMAGSLRTEIADSQIEDTFGSAVYQFDLTLDVPMTDLQQGTVYWMEVSNQASFAGPPTCIWFWMRQSPTANSFSWYSLPLIDCAESQPVPFDQAFCVNFEMEPSFIGSSPGACCTCDGVCTERTLKDCDDVGGQWDVEQPSCGGAVCPSTPSNDNCADGPPLVGEGEYPLPRTCVTTDGYGPIVTDMGSSQIEGDTWLKFIAPAGCQLNVSTCATQARCFDSMLAVYHNPEDPTVCPPCALMSDPDGAAISSATLAGEGCDENCNGEPIPDNGFWSDWFQLGRHALPGECFLIRAGSFPGQPREVEGRLIIDCLNTPAPLQPEPSGVNKSRFISFEVPQEQIGETAIRIQLTSLHHVVPCYIEFCGPSFNAFAGLHVWVGPPQEYVESAASGTLFQAASTQCTPYYHDWSTVGLLHVTGSAIVPSSTYHAAQVPLACAGRETDPDCLPGGANISSQLQLKTTRWGDVVSPFNPPSLSTQPDLADVSALVDKFRDVPGAPIKAQALLVGVDAFGTIDMAANFGFQHIAACADAFRGHWYVHRLGRCATGGDACASNSDCTGTGNAPPCELYCP